MFNAQQTGTVISKQKKKEKKKRKEKEKRKTGQKREEQRADNGTLVCWFLILFHLFSYRRLGEGRDGDKWEGVPGRTKCKRVNVPAKDNVFQKGGSAETA